MFRLPLHVASLTAPAVAEESRRVFGANGARFDAADVALRTAGIPAVLLGTCHRLELIWWGDHDGAHWLSAWLQAQGAESAVDRLEVHDAERAVRHLMSMTAGLESPRFAEVESQQQVKCAWRRAMSAGVTCPDLDAVFAKVIEGARQIRSRISAVSIRPTLGQTAVDAVSAQPGLSWPQARVAIVGTGDAASSFCDALGTVPEPLELLVVGHSAEHGATFAAANGARSVAWSALPDVLRAADVVLFALRTEEPMPLAPPLLEALAARRTGAVWVDVGMPPTILASTLPPTVAYVGLSDLHAAERPDARVVECAQGALQDELDRYAHELHRRRLGEEIQHAQAEARAIAHSELASAMCGASTPEVMTRESVEKLAERLANRVVYATLRNLVHGSAARAR
jgi:glutamyl-tRNA reductase